MRPALSMASLWILCLLAATAGADSRPTAQQCFARGEYQEGIRLLKSAAADAGATTEDRMEANAALARFYAEQVGDVGRAIRFYRAALRAPVPESPAPAAIRGEMERWIAIEADHREWAAQLRQLKAAALERRLPADGKQREARLRDNLRQLTAMLEQPPDEHRLHEVYYVLGLTHSALSQPLSACRAFDRALSIRPAMGLAQPVERLREKARRSWIHTYGRKVARGLCGVLILALAVGGFRARPWQWLRVKHLLAGLVIALSWCAIFGLAHHVLADRHAAAALVNSDHVYPKPVYIHLAFGEPGSEVAGTLFGYGLAAVTGTFFFAAAIGRIRRRGLAVFLGASFALLASGSLAALFYFDHCAERGRPYLAEAAPTGLPTGFLAYPMNDPEPYLLINPRYYQGLELSSIDDPVLIQWLRSHEIESGER